MYHILGLRCLGGFAQCFIVLGLILSLGCDGSSSDDMGNADKGGTESSGGMAIGGIPTDMAGTMVKPAPRHRNVDRMFPIDPADETIRWPMEKPMDGIAQETSDVDGSIPLEANQARALRVDQGNGGFSSIYGRCRQGDYRLENAVVQLCIQGRVSFSPLSSDGGNIIDARLASKPGTDVFLEMLISPEVGEVKIKHMGIVKDGRDGGPAVIRVEGISQGLRLLQGLVPGSFVPAEVTVVTEYRLAPDTDRVEVYSWVVSDYTSGTTMRLYDLIFFGDEAAIVSWPKDPLVREWAAAEAGEVSYSFGSGDGTYQDFLLIGDLIPAVATEHREVSIEVNEAALFKRWFRIGQGDIESLRPAPDGARAVTLSGQPRTRMSIRSSDGDEVTRAQLDESGERKVQLLAGQYTAKTIDYPGGDIEQEFMVGEEPATIELAQSLPAQLKVSVVDGDEKGIAARLNLEGPKEQIINIIDDQTIFLPAGEWKARVSHGWHYTVEEKELTLAQGEQLEWKVTLRKVIETPGWSSGDFHQHASPSLDSQRSVTGLVRANMAEGVDFMVPSDHDSLEDYSWVTKRMGVEQRIATPMTGVEVSPTMAHLGAYGMKKDPQKTAGGAPPLSVYEDEFWRSMEVPELMKWVRDNGAKVIQVNHPRGSQSYFGYAGYKSGDDISTLNTAYWDPNFDTVEVFNGQRDFCEVLADWWGLLNQGLRITGIGNSDTHRIGVIPGYPRNYVPTQAETPTQITTEEIVAALKGGRTTIGGGAVIDFPDGPQPGDTVENMSTVSIRVRLRTPPYARIEKLMAYFNGALLWEKNIESAVEDIIDFDESVTVEAPRDGHLTFIALGEPSLQFIKPGSTVFALSNPIWIDTDGSGISNVGAGSIEKPAFSMCD